MTFMRSSESELRLYAPTGTAGPRAAPRWRAGALFRLWAGRSYRPDVSASTAAPR
jgi:hypothetical protein